MGGVVPFGEVWRTGANEATTLTTEADLEVSGTKIPAGTYTIFTLPESDKWTLIISKKTGEWGTPYPGESDDFARVPMSVEQLSTAVDPLTIALEPPKADPVPLSGAGGRSAPARLCIAWEKTMACVSLQTK
jgi:hypothetical protein